MQEEGVDLKKMIRLHAKYISWHAGYNEFFKRKSSKIKNLHTNNIIWHLASFMQDATIVMLTCQHTNNVDIYLFMSKCYLFLSTYE